MRLDGEAVTVGAWASGEVWSAGFERASFGRRCEIPGVESSCKDDMDWERIRRRQRKRRGEGYLKDDQCGDEKAVYHEELQLRSEARISSPPVFIVGYALTLKKIKSFLQPKLEFHARSKGLVFVPVDCERPLEEQGPFDVILHKMSGERWHQQLKAYKQRHPEVVVLDPPEHIRKVYNRQSMLQEVAAFNLPNSRVKVGVPKQLVVIGDPAATPDRVAKAGLKFPLVAKPLLVDGTEKSHALSLAFNKACLSELETPLVLQEFVNHGGVLFKVYIVGDIVKVVRRFSLPDVQEGEPGKCGVIPFPRVSCAAASAEEADLDPSVGELPPEEMLKSLSKELRSRLGLSLFNLDMIRDGGNGNQYYVIDINYFPGYGKMPDYEKVFTDFFSGLAAKKCK